MRQVVLFVLSCAALLTCILYATARIATVTPSGTELPACTSPNPPQAATVPYCYVPTTVSAKAQQVLRTRFVVLGLNLTDGHTADLFRAAFDARTAGTSTAAVQKYLSSVRNETIAGVKVSTAIPKGFKQANADKMLVYLHGGAYVFGSCYHLWHVTAAIAHEVGVRVICIEYRLAPQNPFPDGLDDVMKVYKNLTANYDAAKLALIGDSAGGGLLLALVLQAKQQLLPLPGAVALMSPWVALARTGDTMTTLTGVDPALQYELNLKLAALSYVDGNELLLSDPLVSPLQANYSRPFPPVLIQVGLRDSLLSMCTLLHRKMKAGGLEVVFSPWEAMWHVFQASVDLPEAQQANREIAQFIQQHTAD